MDRQFKKNLIESLYVHYPLKPEYDKSMETYNLKKPVLSSVSLWDGTSLEPWSFDGEGEVQVKAGNILYLETKSRADHWPENEVRANDAAAGLYATFGSYIARLNVKGLELGKGNRIWFKIRPICPGLHSPIVRVGFVNNGATKIPDVYSREGFNAINLKNNEWNTCTWEIDSIAHDAIEEISFNIHRYGKEVSTGDDLRFELCDIQLQEVKPGVVHGWQCEEEEVVYSTTGYFADGRKTAIANTSAKEFEIVKEEDGLEEEVAYRGQIEKVENHLGSFGVLNFSDLKTEGTYRIRFGNTVSERFIIGNDVLKSTLWKLTNFMYCERCGYPVPNCHGTCHQDVIAEHNGVKLLYAGGWHDAADVSQQTMQTAEILDAMIASAGKVKDSDPMLYRRMMEEANWGLDFVLRMRFGDGYRASHAAIRRWTDNFIGNMDDCEADVHNRSFENFVFAAVEAGAGEAFKELDRELAWKCADAAKEDFRFADERFREVGVEGPYHLLEHTAGSSLSQYYAVAAWAAARIYKITGDSYFYDKAAEFADKVISCQETRNDLPMRGFFCRDESKTHIVHFSHQARDQVFAMALAEVCGALAEHENKAVWEEGLKLHGEYLKGLQKYTAPYGMLPAGIHHISEAEDQEAFHVVHPKVDYERERGNYVEQLKQGIDLGDGYYIRTFPVWFSYRGNSAIQLSMGKAASIIGTYFGDGELIEIAREQLYWTLGKNPFGQSLIYGEGNHYGQEYTALLGETVGEMPVGVQTRGNEDLPYWPPANIATYREVWTTPPGRFMWVAADLI
ncbi:glycoside hydrolase family 9 protein [Lacrimispora sp.]|uniref:glycoside hydrolase family 9 protein n=1 Tax=Lacrimispora sp. TaxID=2719234 RepID=UPI0028A8E51A|nr:glycoside hydrolase family 9 protein [Lacrimispora sp.]